MAEIHPLQHARIARGWTQEYVAEQVGTNQFTIARWESGRVRPRLYFIERLCSLFAMTSDALGFPSPSSEPTVLAPDQAEAQPPEPFLDVPLVGRADDLTRLWGYLAEHRRVALVGLPGIGKTILAQVLAQLPDVQALFPDGILWAGLGPQPDIMALLASWARRLGLSTLDQAAYPAQQALAEMLQRQMRQRSLLGILDDAWSIEAILPFIVIDPRCAFLVTTRFPLLAAQFAHQHVLTLAELGNDESVTLLHHLAPATQHYPQETAALLQSVGGLPLAVHLAGRYLERESVSQQPRRIQAAFARLHDAQTRLQLTDAFRLANPTGMISMGKGLSLQTVIGTSIMALSPDARQTLAYLASFPAKPQSFAEESVLVALAADCPAVIEHLDRLTDAGLLQSAGAGRYCLHQTIADAVHQPLPPHAVARVLHWYHDMLTRHPQPTQMLAEEWATIKGMLALARTLDLTEGGIACLERLVPILFISGLYEVAAEEVALWLGRADAEPEQQRVHLLHAEAQRHLGSLEEAKIAAQQALGRSLPADMRGRWLLIAAQVASSQGDFVQAAHSLHEADAIARSLGDDDLLMQVLRSTAYLDREQGKTASPACEEGLALAQHLEQPVSLCEFLYLLCLLVGNQSDFAPALSSTPSCWPMPYRHGGDILLLQQRCREAEDVFAEVISIAQPIKNQELIAGAEFGQARCVLAQEQRHKAAALAHSSLTRYANMGRHDEARKIEDWFADNLPGFFSHEGAETSEGT